MENKLSYRYASDKVGFYVAVSDADLLSQIDRLMQRNGCVGVMDTAGRIHYVVDGRRGMPYASRRILEAAGRLLRDRISETDPLQERLNRHVDRLLQEHRIRPELKGYRYLRFLLLMIGMDETKLRPISKTLYPELARHFQVKIPQIERDIRYALYETDLRRLGLTPTASIARLYNELIATAEQSLADKDDPPFAAQEGQPDAEAPDTKNPPGEGGF